MSSSLVRLGGGLNISPISNLSSGIISSFGQKKTGINYKNYNNTVLLLDPGNKRSYIPGDSQWLDLSGLENNGLFNSQSKFDDRGRGSIMFENYFASFSNNPVFDLGLSNRPFSWETWFFPLSASASSIGLSRGGGSANWSTNGHSYLAYFNANGSVSFQYRRSSSGFRTLLSSTNVAKVNQWNYAAVTYNGSIVTLYVNGLPVSTSGSTPTKNASAVLTRIGLSSASDASSPILQSFIRIIVNSTLTASDIKENYQDFSSRYE